VINYYKWNLHITGWMTGPRFHG